MFYWNPQYLLYMAPAMLLMLAAQWYGPLPLLAACDVGKAVYCAANLRLSVEQTKSIKKRVEKSGIAFMNEFAHRLLPATIRLKELIATKLGPANLIFCHHRLGEHGRLNGLPGKSGNKCEVDHELVELVDWCSYVIGRKPKWVIGTTHSNAKLAGEEDYQMINLDFSDEEGPRTGPIAQVSCGNYIPAEWTEAISYRPRAQLQVSCENGIAFIDLPSTLIWFDKAGRHQESLDSDRPVGEQLLLQFYRSVTSLVRKTDDLENVCRAISAVQEARRSSCEGIRVELN